MTAFGKSGTALQSLILPWSTSLRLKGIASSGVQISSFLQELIGLKMTYYAQKVYFFRKKKVIYLAGSGLSCKMQDLRCIMWDLSSQHPDSLVVVHRTSFSAACGILVLWPGIKPVFPALQGGLLITGPPGKSLFRTFLWFIVQHPPCGPPPQSRNSFSFLTEEETEAHRGHCGRQLINTNTFPGTFALVLLSWHTPSFI